MIYLYIKRHTTTGLLYFGKTTLTTKEEVIKYLGSGKYWLRHLAKHGKTVETDSIFAFDNIDDAETFALSFSKEHDIVKSCKWANLREENARDGTIKGSKFVNRAIPKKFTRMSPTLETRSKMSAALKGRTNAPRTDEFKALMSEKMLGNTNGTKITEEGRKRISAFNINKIVSNETKHLMSLARKNFYKNKSLPKSYWITTVDRTAEKQTLDLDAIPQGWQRGRKKRLNVR